MLKRSIGLIHATALVVGIIVGSSIFVQPSAIAASLRDVSDVNLVWVVAGVLTLFGALIAAELSTAFPKAGGVYVFLSEAFSPGVAFLWGWAMFWTMHTGIIAAVATVFGRYVAFFGGFGDTGVRVIAIGGVLALSAINYLGVKQGSIVQTSLTVVKLVAIAGITLAAFFIGPREPVAGFVATARDAGPSMVAGIVAALFAYGGWHMVTYAAEETVDPARTLPRALIIGVLIVTACYVALNAAYFHVLSADTVVTSTRVAADAADAVMGRVGAAIVSAVVALSALGALNGIILAGPRVYLAMSRDGLAPRWLGAIHETYRTPAHAIVVQAVWAAVLVSTGTYRALFTRVVYTEWIFFALMAAGLIALRRRGSYLPRFRIPLHPVIPILFIAASLYIVLDQVIDKPGESVGGLLLVLAGWPVYILTLRKSRTQ